MTILSDDSIGRLLKLSLVHRHQRRRLQRQYIARRHERIIQVVEQLEAGVLDQLLFVEDVVIDDLLGGRAKAVYRRHKLYTMQQRGESSPGQSIAAANGLP